ncbi:acyltransferase family protein [Legionella bononiensis]|uniref:Acyltransferase n=1 Tax=Legionella bononiensis TaxID=2793102 RepID=A0ABS1WC07_9GAMM|nr:acyltransferase [Legionella bononiensis]MBL7526891.1 acyltransferase [Legionella bononiensis]MBL7563805.1 acyltransferase [Legionella bononiensis]
MKYRPDVDGLRAIAIIFVLFFHSGLSLFPSGFVGVDVFFVISGFLITSIIHDSLQNNKFSFISFYNRRLWRLQPVFICLIAVSLLMTLLFYLPDDLINFGKSARKTSVFLSNSFFEKVTTGYFSPDSNQLPLLHTWSLSIEWQCYLILPMVIFLLHKICGPRQIVRSVYVLTLLFFVLSLYYSSQAPMKTYYQLVSRIFEFLIGACVALSQHRWSLNKYVINVVSTVAILTLFYIAMRQDISLGFPNSYAFILCLATGIVIASGHCEPKPVWSQILSIRPIVFIGLLSYSLYIWHWPVFVLIRYLNIEETPLVLLSAFCIVFIVAYLSWRFIEKPAGRANKTPFKYSAMLLFALPVGLIHISDYVIKINEGLPQRFTETSMVYETLNQYSSEQRARCLQQKNIEINRDCVLGAKNSRKQTGFLIGDSYSNHHWRFLDTIAQEANVSVLAHATIACLALPGIYQFDMFIKNGVYQVCHDQTARYYSMIRENHFNYVIIGENWYAYLGDKIINHVGDERSHALTQERIEKALDEALQVIVASGAKPVLIKSIAATQRNPHECFFEHIKRRSQYYPQQCEFNLNPKDQQWFDELFARMEQKYPQLVLIDPQKVLCPNGRCKADINGVPVFKDEGHITDYASYHLGRTYLQQYKNPLT